MKKNNVMRVFSLLLALTLISVCAISGTFAKYVTKVTGTDQARVAKWGVLLNVEGNAFATEYQAHDQSYKDAGGEISVKASNNDQVVAPGTSSADLEQTLVGSVKGTPEVAARYIISGTVNDVVLAAGTYTDYTELVYDKTTGKSAYSKTFTLDEDYSPVKWNLVISGKGQEINVADALYEALPDNYIALAESYGLTEKGCSFFDAVKILDKVANGNGGDGYEQVVETALGRIVSGGRNFQLEVTDDGFTMSYDFDPNKEMDYTFELSWAWAFSDVEEDEVSLNDKADTFLGNWAAVKLGQTIDGFVAPAAPSSIEIGATLTATAVQID